MSDISVRPITSTPASPYYSSHACSDTNLTLIVGSPSQNEPSNNVTIKPLTEPKRTQSMFTGSNCVPS